MFYSKNELNDKELRLQKLGRALIIAGTILIVFAGLIIWRAG
jgi:hypothetical protein